MLYTCVYAHRHYLMAVNYCYHYCYTDSIQGKQLIPLQGQTHQMAYGNEHLEQCSSDITLCPAVNVVLPNDPGFPSSAVEKKSGNQRVVIFVIECIYCLCL